MSLYSVVHKDRKRNSVMQNDTNSDSPCSLIEHQMNYEDTESEYASELRRQTYLQKIGKKLFFVIVASFLNNTELFCQNVCSRPITLRPFLDFCVFIDFAVLAI